MKDKFWLLIITVVLVIATMVLEEKILYLLSLFAMLTVLMKPIRDDVRDIKIELKRKRK